MISNRILFVIFLIASLILLASFIFLPRTDSGASKVLFFIAYGVFFPIAITSLAMLLEDVGKKSKVDKTDKDE